MKISPSAQCPCYSNNKYKKCCQPYHKGANASNALLLMRSRYSAFALHLGEYIVATTHQNNQDYTKDTKEWLESIEQFCDNTSFTGLEIMEFTDARSEAFVKFKAKLGDISFVEKSRFLIENGKWLYESGEFITP